MEAVIGVGPGSVPSSPERRVSPPFIEALSSRFLADPSHRTIFGHSIKSTGIADRLAYYDLNSSMVTEADSLPKVLHTTIDDLEVRRKTGNTIVRLQLAEQMDMKTQERQRRVDPVAQVLRDESSREGLLVVKFSGQNRGSGQNVEAKAVDNSDELRVIKEDFCGQSSIESVIQNSRDSFAGDKISIGAQRLRKKISHTQRSEKHGGSFVSNFDVYKNLSHEGDNAQVAQQQAEELIRSIMTTTETIIIQDRIAILVNSNGQGIKISKDVPREESFIGFIDTASLYAPRK